MPTFLTDEEISYGGETGNGITAGGIVILSRQNDGDLDRTFAHERVHVLQVDFFETSVGLSAEEWVGRKLGLDRIPFFDQMSMGVGFVLVHYPLTGPWSRPNDVLEVEAGFLGVR